MKNESSFLIGGTPLGHAAWGTTDSKHTLLEKSFWRNQLFVANKDTFFENKSQGRSFAVLLHATRAVAVAAGDVVGERQPQCMFGVRPSSVVAWYTYISILRYGAAHGMMCSSRAKKDFCGRIIILVAILLLEPPQPPLLTHHVETDTTTGETSAAATALFDGQC